MDKSLKNSIGKAKGKAHAMRASFNRSDNTWASSVGGPGLNFGEHIAGRSRFGTARMLNWSTLKIGSFTNEALPWPI